MIEPKTKEQCEALGLRPPHGMKGKQNAKKCSSKRKSESLKFAVVPGTTGLVKMIMRKRGIKTISAYLCKLVVDDIRRELGSGKKKN